MNGKAELAKALVEKIKALFDCFDHSRVKGREGVRLRIRRQLIRLVLVSDAKVTTAQEARIRRLK